MNIANARTVAQRLVSRKMIRSMAKRPDPDAKVMVRDPKGALVLAADEDQLVEKVAKRIQRQAKTLH